MTYYLSNFGDDNNDGKSTGAPFATIAKLKTVIAAGDVALFHSGHIFYGLLNTLPSSTEKTFFSTYGGSDRAVISAAKIPVSEAWEDMGEDIWRININILANITGNPDPQPNGHNRIGHIKINGVLYAAAFKTLAELDKEFDFYSENSGYFYIRYSGNIRIANVELAPRGDLFAWKDGLHIFNLEFRNSGSHGISQRATGCLINNCKFTELGGSWAPDFSVRYGNGVEIFGGGRDISITGCEFDNIYDVAFTCQGALVDDFQNITFSGNTVKNCSQSIEFWADLGSKVDPKFSSVIVENNYFAKAGEGFGYPVRANKHVAGVHLLLYKEWTGIDVDITIRNNVFDRAVRAYTFNNVEIWHGIRSYNNTIILERNQGLRALTNSTEYPLNTGYQNFIDNTGLEQGTTFLEHLNDDKLNNVVSNNIATQSSTQSVVEGLRGEIFKQKSTALLPKEAGQLTSIFQVKSSIGSSSSANFWTKVAAVNLQNRDYQDFSLTLLLSFTQVDNPQTAIVNFQARQQTSVLPVSSFLVNVLNITTGDALDPSCFKITNAGYGSDFEIWVKKKVNYGQVFTYELGFSTNVGVKRYFGASAWQSATPSGVYQIFGVLRQSEGTSTQTLSSVTSVTIAHGLAFTPTKIDLTPWSSSAKNWDSITVSSTNITVTYPTPITGAWKMSWRAS